MFLFIGHRSRSNMNNLKPLIFIIIAIQLAPSTHSDYTYTPFKEPGLLFERLSNIHFLLEEWTIIKFENMKHTFSIGHFAFKKYEQLISFCQN